MARSTGHVPGLSAEAHRCRARWAEPVRRPSAVGLVVAALVGAVAAGSWTLSTWASLGRAGSSPVLALELAGAAAPAGRPAEQDTKE